VFSVLRSAPIEPHIPDEPTEASVRVLLDHMGYGISYYDLGPAHAPKIDLHLPFPGGEARDLSPVMGIYWLASHDPDVCTVYIDNKPYQFVAAWLNKPDVR